MANFKQLGLTVFLLCLTGCSTPYGPVKGMGSGGYTDKPLDATSYFIRYQLSQQDSMLGSTDVLNPLWKKRASELCGSNDYYYETTFKQVDDQGNESRTAAPSLFGVAYCNNKIQDTRLKAPDAEYQHLQNIPPEAFAIKEANPLWDYLSNAQFDKLESALSSIQNDEAKNRVPQRTFIYQTESLIRLAPSTESLLNAWINAKPQSAFAHTMRASYFIEYGWHKRGNSYWQQVPQQAKDEFSLLIKKAHNDIETAITQKPDLCEAHRLRLEVAKTGVAGHSQKLSAIFDASAKTCPDYLPLYTTYLRVLYPQWGGSYDQMKAFVETNIQRPTIKPLKGWLHAYDADVSMRKGNLDDALSHYAEALAYFASPQFYSEKALVLEKQERYVESLDNYRKAADIAPYSAKNYEGLSRALAKQSKYLDALLASYYVSRSNTFTAAPYYFQGHVFYEMRRYQDALMSYDSALVLEPENAFLMHRKRAAQYQIDIREKEHQETSVKTAI